VTSPPRPARSPRPRRGRCPPLAIR
jgi:hypothetical protein